MSNEIKIFNNDKFGNIRVQKDEYGEPLFCLADVCRALELTNPTMVAQQVCEEFGIPKLDLGMVSRPDGSSIQANFITEQQIYFVMNRSDKPNAKPFQSILSTTLSQTSSGINSFKSFKVKLLNALINCLVHMIYSPCYVRYAICISLCML